MYAYALWKFYSHVNYSVTKIHQDCTTGWYAFYSHVNYSVTKMSGNLDKYDYAFYSHVNYSVTKIVSLDICIDEGFTVT